MCIFIPYTSLFFQVEKKLMPKSDCLLSCGLLDDWEGSLIRPPVAQYLWYMQTTVILLTNTIGRKKGDCLWQVEMPYVCSDPSSNENKIVPDLEMVQRLKLVIWNCQKGTEQNWEGFFCIFHLESTNSKDEVIGSPNYQISLPLCHMASFLLPLKGSREKRSGAEVIKGEISKTQSKRCKKKITFHLC